VEALLQPIVDEAASRLGAPVAVLSVVTTTRQHFAAQHGLTGWMAQEKGTPVEWSFCVHTVRRGAPLAIEDATLQPIVSHSPLIDEGVRSYLGVPLVTRSGYALGSLCVIGPDPRRFGDTDIAQLRELVRTAMGELERRAEQAAGQDPEPA
jgi:GAF domain-containing protein